MSENLYTIVTGASSGIGRAIAVRLSGWRKLVPQSASPCLGHGGRTRNRDRYLHPFSPRGVEAVWRYGGMVPVRQAHGDLSVPTWGNGLYARTRLVRQWAEGRGIESGLQTVFVRLLARGHRLRTSVGL